MSNGDHPTYKAMSMEDATSSNMWEIYGFAASVKGLISPVFFLSFANNSS
jgi:hypothetical protein